MAESSTTGSSRKETISDEAWDEAMNEFINTSLRNTALSQASEAWNHVITVLPKLREILEKKI